MTGSCVGIAAAGTDRPLLSVAGLTRLYGARIGCADVDFDLNSKSLLLQSAGWLLHGTIRSAIQEKLKMDMTPQMERSRRIAQKAMAQVKLVDNVYLKGNLKSVRLADVLVQRDRICIQVCAEGDTAIFFR